MGNASLQSPWVLANPIDKNILLEEVAAQSGKFSMDLTAFEMDNTQEYILHELREDGIQSY